MDEILKSIKQNFHKYVLDESIERIKRCLEELSIEQISTCPNLSSNSVQRLVLHLCGNGQQYIVSGLGGAKDVRSRQQEFTSNDEVSKQELIQLLDNLGQAMWKIIEHIELDDLMIDHKIQSFTMSTLDIIFHVVEHFTYHTGQIVFQTKSLKNIDLEFYSGIDLD